MRMLKKIKALLIAVVCKRDNTGSREDWQSHYSNNVARRKRRSFESYR